MLARYWAADAGRRLFGAEQVAEAGQAVGHLVELVRLAVEHRDAELAQLLELAPGVAALPDHQQVGFQRDHAFDVDLGVAADQRDLLRRFRIVAEVDRADDALAPAGGEQQFGHVRGHRDDALRRRGQRDGAAGVVDDRDGGVGHHRREQRCRDQSPGGDKDGVRSRRT